MLSDNHKNYKNNKKHLKTTQTKDPDHDDALDGVLDQTTQTKDSNNKKPLKINQYQGQMQDQNQNQDQIKDLALGFNDFGEGVKMRDNADKNLKIKHKQDIFVYENILNTFYRYYSNLREGIWHKLTKLNQTKAPTNAQAHTYGKNFYLYKAQKLIDRMIFIRFCKEKGALDGDAVLEALNNKFIKGKYNRLKALFTAMNEGNTELGISKFNGGLFAEDKDLDSLIVDDEIIDRLVDFYSHDFGSELDVNILGHIFEQSISDLETLTGDNQAKRKKDGVFYTPSFIVDYVMHLSIGSWLNNVRARLNLPLIPQPRLEETISDEEWQRLEELGLLPSKQEVLANRRLEEQELEALKNKVKEEDIEIIIYPSFKNNDNDNVKSGSPRLPAVAGMGGESGEPCTKGQNQRQNKWQKWQAYADKLKSIKVLDPSCGSGAFLVKVFDYLQNEWKEVEKHIKTDYTYKDILKNNIYGVDLNPVSAGITKLSLWLKTAHYKEPLTSLDKNIKTGNTLIEDTDLAGYYEEYEGRIITQTLKSNQELFGDDGLNIKSDAEMQELIAKGLQKPLAFNWQKEFESVFKPQNYPQGQGQSQSQDNTHPSLLIKGYERAKKPSANNANIDITNKAFALNNDSLDQSFTEGERKEWEKRGEREMDDELTRTEEDKEAGFDVIVGNPPYGAELSKEVQAYLNDKFKIGTTDTAALFIKQAMLLTKKDGIVSFIVPKSYCYASGYRKLREELQKKTELVADCGLVWKEVLLEQVILKFNKASQTNSYVSSFRRGRVFFFNTIVEHSELSKFGVVLNGISSSELKIANKILESGLFLNDIIAKNQRGSTLPKSSLDGNCIMLGGRNVSQYLLKNLELKCQYSLIKKSHCFIKQDAILAQNIMSYSAINGGRIKMRAFVFDNIIKDSYCINDTINQLIPKKEINKYYLWAILNSDIVGWYIYKCIVCKAKQTMHFDNPVTSKLPVPSVSLEQQNEFEALAKNIISLNQSLKKEALHMVEYIITTFIKYHKPKSKKQALEDFNALKTDTDYNKSIPEINRVANHNSSLAKRLSKDTNEALGEEDIYKLKSRLSKWYETGFNLAELFTILQKFNITVPSKEQLEFVNSKITSQFLKYTNILTGLSVYNNPLQTHTPAGKASWGAGACVLYLLSRTIFYYQKCYTKKAFYNSSLTFAEFFNTKAKECQSLQTQISVLDKEIDAMVYNLYGLTQEEIVVVEG
jgi:hypothetical protein